MPVRTMIDKLIGFDTVSRHSNLSLIHYVQEYLEDHGVASTLVPSDDGAKANLYATIGPPVDGGVVLSGHTDVVPVDGQPWDTDPFTVVEKDGLLYGRGTCDMKAFVAISLALVPEMTQLKSPIHFAFSYDEETGCLGAPRMIEQMVKHLPTPRAVIVGEPTSMQVFTAHKGMTSLCTTVTGHEAHSSQTHRGVSAVMTAARLVTYLSDLAEQFRRDADSSNGFDPAYTTVHVGLIRGGTAVNIISRQCEFEWDIRHVPSDDPFEIVERFKHWCETEIEPAMKAISPNASIVTRISNEAPALAPEPESDAEQFCKNLVENKETGTAAYCTEAGQFQQAGFKTVICGPGSIDQAHQPNEFISLQQVDLGTRFISDVIRQLST